MQSLVFDRLSILAEPLRARMLRLLAQEELAVGELARVVQTSQPTASRHLKQLGAQGWVARRKVGTATWYHLDRQGLDGGQKALWTLVNSELSEEARDPRSVVAADDGRLITVLAQREGDAEEMFRRLGSRWDEVRREQFGDGHVVPTLLALLPPGQDIVDLGCGTGAMLERLAPAAGTLTGVDRERAMLDVARTRLDQSLSPDVAARVVLREGLLSALPLADTSADLALSTLVLHHIREPELVFAEVARILRPGGRWVLLDMVAHDRLEFRRTMGHQHAGFAPDDVQRWATDAGLRLERWQTLPLDPSAQGPGLFLAVLTPPCGPPRRNG